VHQIDLAFPRILNVNNGARDFQFSQVKIEDQYST